MCRISAHFLKGCSKFHPKSKKMAPDPGREYTVSCSLEKAITDPEHLKSIKEAVGRVHKITLFATELLNLYIRDSIENHSACLL